MTDVLAPEQLEEGGAPGWKSLRRQPRDWGLPRGTYEGILAGLDTVRRKDTGQWVVRLLARIESRDAYAFAWGELGNDERDPYALTSRQTRALAKLADQLGILTPAPAEEIVDAIAHLVGRPVSIKIVHTPIGPRATFYASEHTHSGVDDRNPVTSERAQEAYAAQELLLAGLRATRAGFIQSAEACHRLLDTEGWVALGYEGIGEYLAQPELSLPRSTFYSLAGIYRRFVLEGGIPPERLVGAETSKLERTLAAITAGKVTAEEALADSEALGFRDIKAKYTEMMADPKKAAEDPGPEEPEVCPECGRPL